MKPLNYQDAKYNILGMIDHAGKLAERYEYTPYGERQVYTSSGLNDPACMTPTLLSQRQNMYAWTLGDPEELIAFPQPFSLNNIGHQGLYHDEELSPKHIENRARYRTDRFLQRDPWGYVDGMSLYQYVRSNPINLADSAGETSVEWNSLMWNRSTGQVGVTGIVVDINRCLCSKVGVIQFFKFTSVYWPLSRDWHVDDGSYSASTASPSPPYYNTLRPVSDSGTAIISLSDAPYAGYGGAFEFKVYVICAEGSDKGAIYGSYKWGAAAAPWFNWPLHGSLRDVYDLGPDAGPMPSPVVLP